jgi:O-antigen ligase
MRYLLALLIVVLTIIDVFGWTLSLAPGLSVKNAVFYLILLGLVARFVVRGGVRPELPRVFLWFGVLIAYATLTWLAAGLLIRYKFYTLVSSGIDLKANLLDNALVFVLFLYCSRTFGDAQFLLKWMLVAVTAANAIAIGNVVGVSDIGTTEVGVEGNLVGRVFGAFGHANETAALIVCLLPAYVAAAFSSGRIARWFWVLAAAISATLLMMAGSRGAFMGLALAVVFGSYLCRGIISWRRAATLAMTLVVVAVPLLAFVSVNFGNILVKRVAETIQDPGAIDRMSIWLPVVDKMMSNPVTLLTGFGWGSYDVMGFFYAAHNHYLLLWFELGIIGLACYLMLISQLLITARRAAETADDETARYLIAFIYGIIGICGAIFFTLIFKPWLYVWAYIGLTMRMALIATQTALPNTRNEPRRTPAIERVPTVARPVWGPRLSATQRSHQKTRPP